MATDFHHVPDAGEVERAQLTAFTRFVERSTGRRLGDYAALHRWSVEHRDEFWRLFLLWSGLRVEGEVEPVCSSDSCEEAAFFPNLRLNVAENCLGGPFDADDPAIVALTELGGREVLTRGQLGARVRGAAGALAERGVGPGSRVAAIAPSDVDAVTLCLAATGLGATWSSVSPDMGLGTIAARFEQIEPDVLVTPSRFRYQGIDHDIGDRVAELSERLNPRLVVALDDGVERCLDAVSVDELVTAEAPDAGTDGGAWPRLPFNHPLYVLFSSGTTGPPKCIVHGAGGTLVEHVKEHRLHTDLGPDDVLYFQTSAGWMMWNWQLSALASGAAIVVYDGSPTFPDPDRLWRTVAEEGVTVLGTSPTYLELCRDSALEPGVSFDFSRLRLVQSTGSVLRRDLYPWLAEAVAPVPLHSISGGTDIIGCFVMGAPTLPDTPGESSCITLGLDVRAVDDDGEDVPRGAPGELVCRSPFPSRPLGFHAADPESAERARRAFHDAYFAANAGAWTHGDTIVITERGGVKVVGRSDGVMNIRGVRIGPAEVTNIVTELPEIAAALAVDQRDASMPGGFRLLLFVRPATDVTVDRPLTLRLKKTIKEAASIAHVPAEIIPVNAFPETFSGKVSLRAARDAVNGAEVRNLAAIRNPESLDAFAERAR